MKTYIYVLAFVVGWTSLSFSVPFVSIRSQGNNPGRHLTAWHPDMFHQIDCEGVIKTVFSITPAYYESFNPDHLTQCLFDNLTVPGTNSIRISGSQVENRGERDWLADYFYLPTDYESIVTFKPWINNVLVDLNFFMRLDHLYPGLYLNFFMPIVHTRWNLHMCEQIIQKGVLAYDAGYFTPDILLRNQMQESFTSFVNGEINSPAVQTITLPAVLPTYNQTFTTVFRSLQSAKMSSTSKGETRAADIRAEIGWNFIENDHEHLGLTIDIAAPLGNRPEGQWLFEPMVGNGHLWELGGGFNGHYTFWFDQDESSACTVGAYLKLAHMFNARQKRTFDLQGRPGSRYMLFERLGTPIQNNLRGNGITPTAQFQQDFIPLANLSTLEVDVQVSLQTDITLFAQFLYCDWNFGVGYNYWGRTCEKIRIRGITDLELNTIWAAKGDAHVFGFMAADDTPALPTQAPVALSATQSQADLFSGKNIPASATIDDAQKNPAIDNPQPATAGGTNQRLLYAPGLANIAANQINTSIQPLFTQALELDICGAQTRASSQTVFAWAGYILCATDCWEPFISIGAQAEFARNNNKSCSSICDQDCINCGISQWGVWFKGGFYFA